MPRIDWTPFFQTWELAGHYPAILDRSRRVGAAATQPLPRTPRRLLDRIVRERLLRARGVLGFFRANAVGDDIELYADEEPDRARWPSSTRCGSRCPSRRAGPTSRSPTSWRRARRASPDYVGAFAVTAGHGLDELVAAFEAAHDDYNAILAKALADRLAEAFAERLHERVRRESGATPATRRSTTPQLIHEKYQGIRPAPGYPACPDHTEKRTLFDLLGAESQRGHHASPRASRCCRPPR